MKMIDNIFKNIKNIGGYKNNNGENIIKTNKGQFLIKEKIGNKKELYDYLYNRNFTNFLDLENNDIYEIYPYKKDNMNISDKAIDLVYILSMLHTKTTTYQETNLDKIKKIYEEFTSKINYLNVYYHNMQDYIESKVYMSPAEYLLIRNISYVYKMLNISKINIDKWYNLKSKQNRERVVLLHNNVSINNFIDTKNKELKNWDYYTRDCVVYDFYKFYRNDYKQLEFSSLFEIYQKKYKYTKEEKLLFLALITKIWKVKLDDNNYDNCIKINDLVVYVNKTNKFILEDNQKQQKANKDEFKDKNYNIESSSNK